MTFTAQHPDQFHAGSWDWLARRPIVDNKIEDPVTGQVRTAGPEQVDGPPSVDLVITNLHDEATGTYRASRPFPMEKLLAHVLRVVDVRKIALHAVTATRYSVTVVLVDDLVAAGGFNIVANTMANGIWDNTV
ncbi:hypothetical protein SPI_05012 [Niveomyces insectorum RCEF 264]|uniref:Uncharacterized protein n=1 Tax=Niveomyces insectorum RCEF 264 TaxID=1081102 RepID=A0A167TVB5_9HYPO|nr:hypothetical protein SPI_05012 [Niveomyces insectorum RCEF 264]